MFLRIWQSAVRQVEGAEGGGEPPVAGEAPTATPIVQPEAAPQTPPAQDWRERRISQLTARLREAESERDRLRTAPAPAAPAAAVQTPPTAGFSEAEIEARVEARSAQREFDRVCNEAVASGRQLFADFDSKTGDLQRLIDARDPRSVAAYQTLITAAIESGNGPAVLHSLGSNLNEAARILALPPVKMAVEIARMGGELKGRQAEGEDGEAVRAPLPRPITPIGSRGSAHEPIDPTDADRADKLSTAEWMRRRNAQVAGARA